jgi:hypothetical protein
LLLVLFVLLGTTLNLMPRRNNKPKYNAPSPPTQLPTPLPEEERTISDDRLIDFDTPLEEVTYRSPPFRQVHLADDDDDDSPPPLPVPPRAYQHEDATSGHTRWPTYSR